MDIVVLIETKNRGIGLKIMVTRYYVFSSIVSENQPAQQEMAIIK